MIFLITESPMKMTFRTFKVKTRSLQGKRLALINISSPSSQNGMIYSDKPKKATRKNKGGKSQYDRCLKDLDVLQKGTVFLTHWVFLKSKPRPSTLIKAWNRRAGIMTYANTSEIDFIIPIIHGVQVNKSLFGPLFGK